MPSLATLSKNRRFRGMLVGRPGAGKTGALACLANAGYRLRILDFDHNLDPLLEYVQPANYGNIDVIQLEDKLRLGPDGPEPVGMPSAFSNALKYLDNWAYTAKDGTEVNYGSVLTWGPRDVLVVDSLTGMVAAAERRVLKVNNRTPRNKRRQDWQSTVAEVDALIEKATAGTIPCHVIFTAHLTVVSPKGEEQDDSELTKSIKEQVAELMPAKLFPLGATKNHSTNLGQHFPSLLLVETVMQNGKPKRVIRTVPTAEVDGVKLPLAKVAPELPQSNGLLTIFNELLTTDGGSVTTSGEKEAA